MEQIKDTLALSGAGTYDRQVNAQMRQMGVGLTITGWILGAVVAFFSICRLCRAASDLGPRKQYLFEGFDIFEPFAGSAEE